MPTTTESFDAIVIGTGQAGPPLAMKLAGEGRRVLVVERARFGGTCVNYGCIPTKAMVACARAAHMARRAGDFGVEIDGDVTVDMQRVYERTRQIAGESEHGVEQSLGSTDGITVVRGHARFRAARTIEVDGRTFEADDVFVDVGSRARMPDEFVAMEPLTNAGILELQELPKHLIVLGGSYVGLEFAQMFRRFGSRVTVLERGERILAREDEDVSRSVAEMLASEGITIHTGQDRMRGERRNDHVAVLTQCGDEERWVEGTHALVAAGRIPNTDDLGVEAAGLEVDERGYLRVDDTLRTNVPGVWALGDCNGRGGFTHTAYNDHEIVADQLLGHGRRTVRDRIDAYALYTDPPLGRIGIDKRRARQRDGDVLRAHLPMSRVGRAKERGETHGFVEILIDAKTERILGATVHGIEGDEVVHSLLNVMYADASYRVIAESVGIHPTVSELIPTALQSLEPLE